MYGQTCHTRSSHAPLPTSHFMLFSKVQTTSITALFVTTGSDVGYDFVLVLLTSGILAREKRFEKTHSEFRIQIMLNFSIENSYIKLLSGRTIFLCR